LIPFLVIESGATKLDWVLADKHSTIVQGTQAGLHPQLVGEAHWKAQLQALSQGLPVQPQAIFYYGTGCASLEGQRYVEAYFGRYWPGHPILAVASDLLGAARALCQHESGLVGILGTGSNVAAYAHGQLVAQRGGLGYILGDEGSGAALGKALLRAFLYQTLPPMLMQHLREKEGLERGAIIDALYRGASPSRYLAQWATLVHRWRSEPIVQAMIRREFEQLIQSCLLPLSQKQGTKTIHFTGSVAVHFKEELEATLAMYDLSIGQLVTAPLEQLIRYHQTLA
jgi:glucosamine kinase